MTGRRSNASHKRAPSASKKSVPDENGSVDDASVKHSSPPPEEFYGEDRTVKKLRMTKALTIPEGTTVSDACRRMAARRVDAVLLTDAKALLSGIVTDKDIASRVIAEGLRPDQTIVSKIMTRNPTFVTSDTLAIEALQKMVQGKFRHLPVVENGEVIALLDITKCLYDAISKMQKAAEQGSAIAAAVEGVDGQRGPSAFIEILREHMFKPSLSTIVGENSKVAIVSPADPVYVASKKMRDLRVNAAVIVTGSKILGILTSKDILMRVVAQNLSPELTLVEKVMTANPECASLETTIVEAMHMMRDGKFLHLPVLDRDGYVVACVDVLEITHAAISMVESGPGAVSDVASTMMEKFWDSALTSEPPEDSDTHGSEFSTVMTSDEADMGKSTYTSVGFENSFTFKFEDMKGLVHRVNCGTEHLDELVSAIMQRLDYVNDEERPLISYEDEEGDKITVATDSDLAAAVSYARSAGMKALRLFLEFSQPTKPLTPQSSSVIEQNTEQKTSTPSIRYGILAGAVVVTSISVLLYLKRSK